MKIRGALLLLMSLCVGIGSVVQAQDQYLPEYRIGIVTDGPNVSPSDWPDVFISEIEQMATGEFKTLFPEDMLLEADSTRKGVGRAFDRLLADPECDLIIMLGFIGSSIAVERKEFSKPVVAPLIFDAQQAKAPLEGTSSGVGNLLYIDLGVQIDQGLITFRNLVDFKRLTLILDERDVKGVPAAGKLGSYLANEHSLTVHLVPVVDSAQEALSQIPAETEAVMVGSLWRFSDTEIARLAEGLSERTLPSFTLASYDYLEAGMFATLRQDGAEEQLARQVAINIQEILLGEEPGALPVFFSQARKLAINMATARAINVYPSLDYMTGARIINEERTDIERRLTLAEVVAEALAANLDLVVAEREVAAGSFAVNEARSPLLPQVFIGTGASQIDDDRAEASNGANPENSWTGDLGFSQEIYSDRSWTGYSVEKFSQTGREFNRDSVKLNIIFEASTAYFNVLRQKTIERVQKDNMQLTQANLERAQIRLSSGIAGPDELYRWQTKFATDRQIVLLAESATFDAQQALNRIINRPLQEEFIAEETDLNNPLIMGGDRLFYDLIHNPLYFREFRNFMVAEGLAAAPELKAFDSAIAAQERIIVGAGRDYWLPDFIVEGDVQQYFENSGAGERDSSVTDLDETDWQVGVFARLPLFEGGRKTATLGRNREELLQLQTSRDNSEDRINQQILQSLNNTRASYPSIKLSRDALDAAKNNLQLVTDSYVQGIKSIIDLLDAQNQALNAELGAANSVYDFLIDLMGLQRSIGTFVTFMPTEAKEEWINRFKEYAEVNK
ncbi:MAG: TolC family protein [Desulfofustis sp.]|nr:TolC family protein [Desulfofustis sp.]